MARLGMSDTSASEIISSLKASERELRERGVRRLSLFGSYARREEGIFSDVDLAVEFEPGAKIDLIELAAIERRLAKIVGRKVDVLTEPVKSNSLRANLEKDRRIVF